jgi:hypothetical protein
MIDRLPQMITVRERHREVLLRNLQDPEKDRTGSATSSLARTEAFLSVASFVLDGDVDAFRRQYSHQARMMLTLFRRFDDGESISPSYVSMTQGASIQLDALAAGDFELALESARLVGGRTSIEREHDHAFDRSLGYAVKHFILDEPEAAVTAVSQFAAAAAGTKADQPFVDLLKALAVTDGSAFSQAVSRLEAAHKRLAASGRWKNTNHELICLWGLALCNLASYLGIRYTVANRFIPTALVRTTGGD